MNQNGHAFIQKTLIPAATNELRLEFQLRVDVDQHIQGWCVLAALWFSEDTTGPVVNFGLMDQGFMFWYVLPDGGPFPVATSALPMLGQWDRYALELRKDATGLCAQIFRGTAALLQKCKYLPSEFSAPPSHVAIAIGTRLFLGAATTSVTASFDNVTLLRADASVP
jgi:hypothetical protein